MSISLTDGKVPTAGRLQDVEIRHLAALCAVARARSFGRAADRLGYTQSAVSQQISVLERMVGGALFDRPGGPKKVSLTPLGQRLVAHAEEILGRMSMAEADLEAFISGVTGTLSVGTFQSTSVRLLPAIIRRLRKERPDLKLELTDTNDQPSLLEALSNGELDVSFIAGPIVDDGLHLVELIEDPFVLVSPLDTDLAPEEETVSAASLDGVPLIGEHDSTCQRQIEGALVAFGVTPRVLLRSVDNAAIIAMVASGMGHAVMPALAVAPLSEEVLIRRMSPGIPARIIYIAKPSGRAVFPATDRFIELAVESAQSVSNGLDWARPAARSVAPRTTVDSKRVM